MLGWGWGYDVFVLGIVLIMVIRCRGVFVVGLCVKDVVMCIGMVELFFCINCSESVYVGIVLVSNLLYWCKWWVRLLWWVRLSSVCCCSVVLGWFSSVYSYGLVCR